MSNDDGPKDAVPAHGLDRLLQGLRAGLAPREARHRGADGRERGCAALRRRSNARRTHGPHAVHGSLRGRPHDGPHPPRALGRRRAALPGDRELAQPPRRRPRRRPHRRAVPRLGARAQALAGGARHECDDVGTPGDARGARAPCRLRRATAAGRRWPARLRRTGRRTPARGGRAREACRCRRWRPGDESQGRGHLRRDARADRQRSLHLESQQRPDRGQDLRGAGGARIPRDAGRGRRFRAGRGRRAPGSIH